jgi:early secretory antigenic target protein ESAT-6
MPGINVTFESLQAGQVDIQKTYSALVTTLDDLEHLLKPMISAWSGGAQQVFASCKQEWDVAAANLSQVLNGIGQVVGNAHDNYRAAEQAAQNNWT